MARLFGMFDKVQEELLRMRSEKRTQKLRPRYYCVYLDWSMAFDKCDKDLVILRLLQLQVRPRTIMRIARWLSSNQAVTEKESIPIKVGLP